MRARLIGYRGIPWLVLLVSLLATSAPAARTKRVSRGAASQEAPAVPLSDIHVFGDRPAPFALDAKSAMMVDQQTDAVLYSYNEHARMQPASLAKIMTFYLVLDALAQKRITLDTMMPISEQALGPNTLNRWMSWPTMRGTGKPGV